MPKCLPSPTMYSLSLAIDEAVPKPIKKNEIISTDRDGGRQILNESLLFDDDLTFQAMKIQ